MISKKFKHGDIVIADLGEYKYFFKVVLYSDLIFKADKEKYLYYLEEANRLISEPIVIVKTLDSNFIDWVYEQSVRLATKAEKILYAENYFRKA